MTRDSERSPEKGRGNDEETGARDDRTGRSTGPEPSSTEDIDAEGLEEVLIPIIDEAIDLDRRNESVAGSIRAEATITEREPVQLETREHRASRLDHSVTQIVAPKRRLSQSRPLLQVPVATNIQAERVSPQTAAPISPRKEISTRDDHMIEIAEQVTAERTHDRIADQRKPTRTQSVMQQRARSDGPTELDDRDPVFEWTGGVPYGSGRPSLVIHRSREELSTLPFLHVLLRDTYTEIEGGEPGAETVEFVANEPRVPQVQKNIVTMDLTESGWSSSVRNGDPVIERNNVDIVPTLQEVASTLYTGQLGYFVVNVPDDWEGDLIQSDFFEKLVERLTGTLPAESDDQQSVFESTRSSPVIVATPTVDDEEELLQNVSSYFSLSDAADDGSTVEQIGAAAERYLRRDDWKRIALTRRQHGADESDEHYLWKGAIAEGIAWQMYRSYRQRENDDVGFEQFLQENILRQGPISTEASLNSPSEDNEVVTPDIYVSPGQNWAKDGLSQFVAEEYRERGDLVVEFETGRSEGAFNFRKIRESLEKYSELDRTDLRICIVVPPRLLFRGHRRARMIVDLVEKWNELETETRGTAGAFVPTMSGGYCNGLRLADEFVDDLYGEERKDE